MLEIYEGNSKSSWKMKLKGKSILAPKNTAIYAYTEYSKISCKRCIIRIQWGNGVVAQ